MKALQVNDCYHKHGKGKLMRKLHVLTLLILLCGTGQLHGQSSGPSGLPVDAGSTTHQAPLSIDTPIQLSQNGNTITFNGDSIDSSVLLQLTDPAGNVWPPAFLGWGTTSVNANDRWTSGFTISSGWPSGTYVIRAKNIGNQTNIVSVQFTIP